MIGCQLALLFTAKHSLLLNHHLPSLLPVFLSTHLLLATQILHPILTRPTLQAGALSHTTSLQSSLTHHTCLSSTGLLRAEVTSHGLAYRVTRKVSGTCVTEVTCNVSVQIGLERLVTLFRLMLISTAADLIEDFRLSPCTWPFLRRASNL